jgi:hypothetical protein
MFPFLLMGKKLDLLDFEVFVWARAIKSHWHRRCILTVWHIVFFGPQNVLLTLKRRLLGSWSDVGPPDWSFDTVFRCFLFKLCERERLIVVTRTWFDLALNLVREPFFTNNLVRFWVKLCMLVDLHRCKLEVSVFVICKGTCGLLLEICCLVLVWTK